jgi:hypothetical protein
MAEGRGFEPLRAISPLVFETSALPFGQPSLRNSGPEGPEWFFLVLEYFFLQILKFLEGRVN